MKNILANEPTDTDQWPALQAILTDIVGAGGGCLRLPAGRYFLSRPLTVGNDCRVNVSIVGAGRNVTTLLPSNASGAISFRFAQQGQNQPWGLNLSDLQIHVFGHTETAIDVSYGNPLATSDHFAPSTTIRDVTIQTRETGILQRGIRIEAAWNVSMTNVSVSGNPMGGNWGAIQGSGIQYERMCVNARHVNVECNFWATGFYYNAAEGGNTEGLFFSNCIMVGVQRGCWVIGNPNQNNAPRVSTFVWQGGMIECRVAGVGGGSAAFHLVHVWTGLIVGCQMLAETIPITHTTYGLFIDTCAGIIVSACDINAWHIGTFTTGPCSALNINGNTYTNCATQVIFNPDTTGSRSYGHVLFNNDPSELNHSGNSNKMGFVS